MHSFKKQKKCPLTFTWLEFLVEKQSWKRKESVAVFMPKGRYLKLARQQMTQNKFKAILE